MTLIVFSTLVLIIHVVCVCCVCVCVSHSPFHQIDNVVYSKKKRYVFMKGNKLTAHLYGLDSWLPSGADRQEQLGSFEYTGSEPQPQSF